MLQIIVTGPVLVFLVKYSNVFKSSILETLGGGPGMVRCEIEMQPLKEHGHFAMVGQYSTAL